MKQIELKMKEMEQKEKEKFRKSLMQPSIECSARVHGI